MKKEGFSLDKLKKIPKNQLLIGALVGILLLVVAIPVEHREKGQNEDSQSQVQEDQSNITGGSYGKSLGRRLEQVLADVEGVGKVKVMITLQDEGELVVEKDRTQNSQNSSEQDGAVKRSSTEGQFQEETVYSQNGTSAGEPFVKKEVAPKVEGVLVVAEGGGDAKIVKNISDAVLALFSVEAHKIKVVKMN